MAFVKRALPLSVVLLSVVHPGAVRGQTSADPLVDIADGDPLELGRVAEALGDDGVLERLSADRPVAVRLAAVRATVFLHEPERALPTLADLAGGRDPDLAPAAASSALRIARGLDAAGLAARELTGEELRATIERFASVAGDASARADIRRAVSIVRLRLTSFLNP